MVIRKTLLLLLIIASMLFGALAATSYHFYRDFFNKPKEPARTPAPLKAEEPHVKPEAFFQVLNLQELNLFDQLYEQRQNQLRDLMAAGSEEAMPVPPGVFAQHELIQSKIAFLGKLVSYSEAQDAVKHSLAAAYQFLKEAFDKEIEFLKRYPMEAQNISFITENIFEISSKDQRSGVQYLDCLVTYRKALAEAIREDQGTENNQSRVKDLMALNALIEKYKIRLNVPKETF